MPVVINTLEVNQEQTRATSPDSQASAPAMPARPDPEEIRRLLDRMRERLLRLQAH